MENTSPIIPRSPAPCGQAHGPPCAGTNAGITGAERRCEELDHFLGADPAATDMLLPADLAGQLVSLAEITYPFEACGLLIGQQIDHTVVVEQITYGRNLESTSLPGAPRPRGFRLDPDDFLAADVAARSADRDIVGVWYSHPETPAHPTKRECAAAWAGYSYLIVSVSAVGAVELRSWRLMDDRFLEERLR